MYDIIAWAARQNLLRKVAARVLPSKAKSLIAHRFNIKLAHSYDIPSDYRPYLIRGQRYANSNEEKFREREITDKGMVRTANIVYHPNRLLFYRSKIAPFFPILDTLVQANPSLRIVDVAGGSGIISYLCSEQHPSLRINGIEMSYQSCLVANKHLPGTYIQGDAEDLPIRDQSADIVLLVSALHHFYRYPERILSECYRIMKPGGYLYITDPAFCVDDANKDPNRDRVVQIQHHVLQIFELLTDIVDSDGWPPKEGVSEFRSETEERIPVEVTRAKLLSLGFRVLDSGYHLYIKRSVAAYSFGFDIATAIDTLLDSVGVKGVGHVYFIARKD